MRQILGLLVMYFEGVVVVVKNFSVLFRLALAIRVTKVVADHGSEFSG